MSYDKNVRAAGSPRVKILSRKKRFACRGKHHWKRFSWNLMSDVVKYWSIRVCVEELQPNLRHSFRGVAGRSQTCPFLYQFYAPLPGEEPKSVTQVAESDFGGQLRLNLL